MNIFIISMSALQKQSGIMPIGFYLKMEIDGRSVHQTYISFDKYSDAMLHKYVDEIVRVFEPAAKAAGSVIIKEVMLTKSFWSQWLQENPHLLAEEKVVVEIEVDTSKNGKNNSAALQRN